MQTIHMPSRLGTEKSDGAHTADKTFEAPRQLFGPRMQSHVHEQLNGVHRNDEILAILCHELQSPLTAVQNVVDMLRGHAAQDVAASQRLHALIERQVRYMMRLTAGLLEVSRISLGQLRLQRERIDLRVILGHVIETMEAEFQLRGHRLATRWCDEPVWLQADADRLNQVFLNLLTNASKYTDPGGNLSLSLQVRDREAVVCVRDSGIGIAAETLPHIFGLFIQADQAGPRAGEGLGIGLALVRTLVELHGGSVAAASAGLGRDSEFTVRLPVEA